MVRVSVWRIGEVVERAFLPRAHALHTPLTHVTCTAPPPLSPPCSPPPFVYSIRDSLVEMCTVVQWHRHVCLRPSTHDCEKRLARMEQPHGEQMNCIIIPYRLQHKILT